VQTNGAGNENASNVALRECEVSVLCSREEIGLKLGGVSQLDYNMNSY